MLAKLRPMEEMINLDPTCATVKKNNHYWKFYYTDKPTLGFRDFYLKYWKGDRFVTVKPKRDRKKNIIPNKFEVYGKRGNYVFTAYSFWFEWIGQPQAVFNPEIKKKKETEQYPLRPEWVTKSKDIVRPLVNLPWNDLFEI